MKNMKKAFIALLAIGLTIQVSWAKEGMWLPQLLKNLNESDMQTMGLKLSAEDIYSINQSSLKDAIVSFGGFCTAEVISDQGLLLTNHHCGYRAIQSHSSVENDYLTNGYWAKTHADELPNPDLTATFIVRIEDVTKQVLADLSDTLNESQRQKAIANRIKEISKEKTKGTNYDAFIKPFFYGNEYYLFVTETFKDVRLVGAPPSSIGKFGGDTDNWMWPRHTGDFSIFRIYANKDNEPAEYSEDNVPYRPKNVLSISLDGIKKDDFTMVFGFPGRTQEYLTSYAIQQIKDVINPPQIAIRRMTLDVMDKHMSTNDKVRIQYASKYASIANYWKKWIGENRGLEKANAIARKQKLEKEFIEKSKGIEAYEGLMDAFKNNYEKIEPYAVARSYFSEIPYRKIEIIRLAAAVKPTLERIEEGDSISEDDITALKEKIALHFKDYDAKTDMELSEVLFEKYANDIPQEFQPKQFSSWKKDWHQSLTKLYAASKFNNKEALMKVISSLDSTSAKKLKKDPAYELMTDWYAVYNEQVKPNYDLYSNAIDSLSKIYVKGLRELVPGKYYPDANSTLRLAYGKVDDYSPRNAVQYEYFTDARGILEKYDQDHPDFQLPQRLIDLIKAKDYGQYADEDGYLHVCFTASNHTTGGNSGSPVLNAKGELIGLNFDRNWEGTMSDINYDVDQCRNISVDIRYVLFVVDKYAQASHLVEEMKLVKSK